MIVRLLGYILVISLMVALIKLAWMFIIEA